MYLLKCVSGVLRVADVSKIIRIHLNILKKIGFAIFLENEDKQNPNFIVDKAHTRSFANQ